MLLFAVIIFNVQARDLDINAKLPGGDYTLQNIDGKNTSLDKIKKTNGVLVFFSCNTCPWVIRWQDRYNLISALSKKNGIGFVAVNSNARLHDSVDSMDEMIYHATANEYDFPYVMDEDAKLAKAFGAMKTPHVYLFDANDRLVYTGAIDDNAKSAKSCLLYTSPSPRD